MFVELDAIRPDVILVRVRETPQSPFLFGCVLDVDGVTAVARLGQGFPNHAIIQAMRTALIERTDLVEVKWERRRAVDGTITLHKRQAKRKGPEGP